MAMRWLAKAPLSAVRDAVHGFQSMRVPAVGGAGGMKRDAASPAAATPIGEPA